MTTISSPFVNGILPNARNFAWCAISPTKIALLYIATTDGIPRYFVQFVNFVNREPVYGKASLILNQTLAPPANTGQCPRIVNVGNSRLLFCTPKAQGGSVHPSQYSFVLVKYTNDIAEFLHESEVLQVSTYSSTTMPVPQLVGGEGNATFHNILQNSSNLTPTFWTLTVNPNDTLTLGAAEATATANVSGSGTNLINHGVVRKALDGVQWAVQVIKASAGGIFKKTGGPQLITEAMRSNAFSLASTSYVFDSMLPIRGDDFLLLNTTSARLYSLQRDVNGSLEGQPVLKRTLPSWISPAISQIYDIEWLDDDGTFVILGHSASLAEIVPLTTDVSTTVATMMLYVGKYSEISQSITLSPESPIVSGLQITKRTSDKYIHFVDNKTIALIGGFDPVPGGWAIAPGIVMMKAD